jgi:hypothetical protein
MEDNVIGYSIGGLWVLQVLLILHYVPTNIAKKILLSTMWAVIFLFLVTQLIAFQWRGALWETAMLVLQLCFIGAAKRFDFRWLALAFFVHGSWDLWHLTHLDFIEKPAIYSQICVPYDWTVATYILWRNWKI